MRVVAVVEEVVWGLVVVIVWDVGRLVEVVCAPVVLIVDSESALANLSVH